MTKNQWMKTSFLNPLLFHGLSQKHNFICVCLLLIFLNLSSHDIDNFFLFFSSQFIDLLLCQRRLLFLTREKSFLMKSFVEHGIVIKREICELTWKNTINTMLQGKPLFLKFSFFNFKKGKKNLQFKVLIS